MLRGAKTDDSKKAPKKALRKRKAMQKDKNNITKQIPFWGPITFECHTEKGGGLEAH